MAFTNICLITPESANAVSKSLLFAAMGMVCVQCAVYGFDLPMPFMILATLIAKHPAGMTNRYFIKM